VIHRDITLGDVPVSERRLNFDHTTDVRIIAILLMCTLALLACEESLPPRVDPDTVLVTALNGLEGTVTITDSVQTSLPGSFFIQLTNVYDEVLQDDVRIAVTVDVWMKDQPQHRVTVQVGRSDLMNGNIIQAGMVTLGPDSSANFLKRWNHRTDNNQPFWEFVRLTRRTTTSGRPYLESDPIRFVGQAHAQLFEHVQPIASQRVEFTFVYWIF